MRHHNKFDIACLIAAVPGRVQLLRLSNTIFNSSNVVIVSWRKPDGGDEIDEYFAEWYQQGSDQRSGFKYVDHVSKRINYFFKVTDLQFKTKYIFWVYAKNSAGYGSFETAYITTGNSS